MMKKLLFTLLISSSFSLFAQDILSTTDFQDKTKFEIRPNPSKTTLNIKLSSLDKDLKVEVFDVLGKRVYKGIINELNASVNVSSWNSGVYLVRVFNDKSTQTKRFLKQ